MSLARCDRLQFHLLRYDGAKIRQDDLPHHESASPDPIFRKSHAKKPGPLSLDPVKMKTDEIYSVDQYALAHAPDTVVLNVPEGEVYALMRKNDHAGKMVRPGIKILLVGK